MATCGSCIANCGWEQLRISRLCARHGRRNSKHKRSSKPCIPEPITRRARVNMYYVLCCVRTFRIRLCFETVGTRLAVQSPVLATKDEGLLRFGRCTSWPFWNARKTDFTFAWCFVETKAFFFHSKLVVCRQYGSIGFWFHQFMRNVVR